MAKYNPRRIYGSWKEGYVLDLHTSSSSYIGDDEFGHPKFVTTRTEIGELLYRLKYRSDVTALKDLVDSACSFIQKWAVRPSLIVPVPATRTYRKFQPVALFADGVGARLKVAVCRDAIRKKKRFAELKNVYDAEERRLLLEDAFEVKASSVQEQRVLLIDDLYRSGATMNALAQVLLASGAREVNAFALTQTRSHI